MKQELLEQKRLVADNLCTIDEQEEKLKKKFEELEQSKIFTNKLLKTMQNMYNNTNLSMLKEQNSVSSNQVRIFSA